MLARVRDSQCRPAGIKRRNLSLQADLFKVLADPHRLKIFAAIAGAEDEVCVCDLTDGLPLEQPTVSHHLRLLREKGLVVSERRGTWVYYRLAPGADAVLRNAIEVILNQPSRSARAKAAS